MSFVSRKLSPIVSEWNNKIHDAAMTLCNNMDKQENNMHNHEQGMDMGFTREIIPECHHICLIYDNEEERKGIVSAYLAAGIRSGEIVRYATDTIAPDEIRAWVSEKGVEIREENSFRIMRVEDAYYPSGSFVPQQILDNATSRYAMAKQAGFAGSRIAAEMSWALRDIPGADRLLEYEVGLNKIQNDFPRVGMCQYDARLFDGALLFKVLQVHPYMIALGQIVRNPFYIKPEEFEARFRASG
jgi:hypothetical protein